MINLPIGLWTEPVRRGSRRRRLADHEDSYSGQKVLNSIDQHTHPFSLINDLKNTHWFFTSATVATVVIKNLIRREVCRDLRWLLDAPGEQEEEEEVKRSGECFKLEL